MSIFLSTAALGNQAPALQITDRPFALAVYTKAMPTPPVENLDPVKETTTTTTTLPETTTTVVQSNSEATPETVPVQETPVDTACGPYKMSKVDAHACWDGLIGKYDWPFTTAFNVMYCESTGNYANKNKRSSATGLFQVLGGPIDPDENVAIAYGMWQERGWQPWTASAGCW